MGSQTWQRELNPKQSKFPSRHRLKYLLKMAFESGHARAKLLASAVRVRKTRLPIYILAPSLRKKPFKVTLNGFSRQEPQSKEPQPWKANPIDSLVQTTPKIPVSINEICGHGYL